MIQTAALREFLRSLVRVKMERCLRGYGGDIYYSCFGGYNKEKEPCIEGPEHDEFCHICKRMVCEPTDEWIAAELGEDWTKGRLPSHPET